jgi:hypothetical protein
VYKRQVIVEWLKDAFHGFGVLLFKKNASRFGVTEWQGAGACVVDADMPSAMSGPAKPVSVLAPDSVSEKRCSFLLFDADRSEDTVRSV